MLLFASRYYYAPTYYAPARSGAAAACRKQE